MQKLMLILALTAMSLIGGCQEKQAPSVPSQATSLDQFATLDGQKIRLKIEGNPKQPALVLLHGFTSSLESWDLLSAQLKNDYQIIRFDLPGHGLSGPDPKARYSQQDLVKATRALIVHLGLEKPTLIGNSMGGNLAWRYAANYPKSIDKLILIDASGFPLNGLGDQPLPLPDSLKSYFLQPNLLAIGYGLRSQYADISKIPKTRADTLLAMMSMPGNGQAYVQIFGAFTLPDPTQMLSEITAPTLIIWGDQDNVIPANHAKLFANSISGSVVKYIENTGHLPHEEQPVQTASAIKQFLQKE